MDRSAAQQWLDRYIDAWKRYDRDAIGSLFAEDAEYRYHPYDPQDEVVRGRNAIVADWVEPEGDPTGRDTPGTYDGHYEPFAVEGDRVVAVGWSRYWTDDTRSTLRDIYHNVFLLRFDEQGRCRSFTEFYMKEPGSDATG